MMSTCPLFSLKVVSVRQISSPASMICLIDNFAHARRVNFQRCGRYSLLVVIPCNVSIVFTQEFRILPEIPLAKQSVKYYVGGLLVVCYQGDQAILKE